MQKNWGFNVKDRVVKAGKLKRLEALIRKADEELSADSLPEREKAVIKAEKSCYEREWFKINKYLDGAIV